MQNLLRVIIIPSSSQQGSVPPVMAFHLGSLGFLTPFNFENFQSQVTQVIEGDFFLEHGCSMVVIVDRLVHHECMQS